LLDLLCLPLGSGKKAGGNAPGSNQSIFSLQNVFAAVYVPAKHEPVKKANKCFLFYLIALVFLYRHFKQLSIGDAYTTEHQVLPKHLKTQATNIVYSSQNFVQ